MTETSITFASSAMRVGNDYVLHLQRSGLFFVPDPGLRRLDFLVTPDGRVVWPRAFIFRTSSPLFSSLCVWFNNKIIKLQGSPASVGAWPPRPPEAYLPTRFILPSIHVHTRPLTVKPSCNSRLKKNALMILDSRQGAGMPGFKTVCEAIIIWFVIYWC